MFKKNKPRVNYHGIGDVFSKPKKSHKKRNALILGGSAISAILMGAAAKKQDKP